MFTKVVLFLLSFCGPYIFHPPMVKKCVHRPTGRPSHRLPLPLQCKSEFKCVCVCTKLFSSTSCDVAFYLLLFNWVFAFLGRIVCRSGYFHIYMTKTTEKKNKNDDDDNVAGSLRFIHSSNDLSIVWHGLRTAAPATTLWLLSLSFVIVLVIIDFFVVMVYRNVCSFVCLSICLQLAVFPSKHTSFWGEI